MYNIYIYIYIWACAKVTLWDFIMKLKKSTVARSFRVGPVLALAVLARVCPCPSNAKNAFIKSVRAASDT